MIRVIILTSSKKGTAAHHLPALLQSQDIQVGMVIHNRGVITNKWKHYKRKLKKVFQIGILGTVNGMQMRKWYTTDLENYLKIDDIQSICEKENIAYHEVDSINSSATKNYFLQAKADLGISLGNGYISSGVFNIPRLGMINIHHEILPDFQNAQSVIWQIYKNSGFTGYTIHQVTSKIDAGNIIYQEKVPIQIKSTLGETVTATYASLLEKSSTGLVYVLQHFEKLLATAKHQSGGEKYTTPSHKQMQTIKKNFLVLKNKSLT
jgi:methionyl-tRNA formyltransferase